MTHAPDPKIYYDGAEFGPSEVARLTGVSPEVQRDWRRRGILAMRVEGRARFYSTQVAELLVRKALNDVGVPLTSAGGAVALGGLELFWAAMQEVGALERAEGLSEEEHRYIDAEAKRKPSLRYLVVPHPHLTAEDFEAKLGKPLQMMRELLPAWPASDLDGIARAAETFQVFGVCSWSVIDVGALAAKFAKEAERPIAVVRPGAKPERRDA